MKERCYNPKNKSYKDYGGRGIKVCYEWLNDSQSFIDWCESNKWVKGLFLDRIDNNGNYSPENCRLVTHMENCLNQRKRRNNTTGVAGVSIHNGKYRARVSMYGKRHHIGVFESLKEAKLAIDNFKNNQR